MVNAENYPCAYKEVYEILKNIDESYFRLVPDSFITMLENNMDPNYCFTIKNSDFDSQELLQETKTILAYLYLNYWATDIEKVVIKEKFKKDILKDEKRKKLKYGENLTGKY